MMKAFKKITFTLLIGSVLALSGLAKTNDYWQGKPKQDKPKEKLPEAPKKDKDDRGGGKKDEGKKKDKKPDDEGF
ncbi:MAG: hypothetical protein ACREAM_22670 [Blastocatellia bacterium]